LKKVRYYVEAIDYSNFMFEVVDAYTQKDGCFISHRSLIKYKFNNKDYSPFNFGWFNNSGE
jgi:sulfur relay (sulfurtransferase) DsrF/TusC family protein